MDCGLGKAAMDGGAPNIVLYTLSVDYAERKSA